jgi:Family of unknown function (DUF695)
VPIRLPMRLLRRSSSQPVSPNADAARWALVETVRDGRKLWVRRNLALEPLLAAPSHPLLLCVTVAGDPTDPEHLAKLGGFETALIEILGDEDLCWAAAIVTTEESRQFLFYAREREPLVARLAFIKQGFPIEFELALQEDADWAVLRRVPGRT